MARGERVSPHSSPSTHGGGLVRRLVTGASLLILVAACVACAVTLKRQGRAAREELSQELAFGDSSAFHPASSSATREGSVRDGVKPDFHKPLGNLARSGLKVKEGKALHRQQLAFGDSGGFKRSKDAEKREGGVRNGVKPDFHKPLGDLGKKGLAKGAKAPAQALAFGDSDGFKAAKDAEKREGGVRNGVKPDFHKPLGDLGKKGLAKKDKQGKAQALAFGDSKFHAGSVQAKREGSVRGGKAPDFKPPLGSLGETGLVQKKQMAATKPAQQAMSALGAREAADNFYSEEARAERERAAAAPAAAARGGAPRHGQGKQGAAARPVPAPAKDTHEDLDRYYDKLVQESGKERSSDQAKSAAAAERQQREEASYFAAQMAGDAKQRAEAIKRGLAEDKAMARLVAKEDKAAEAAHGGGAAAARKKGLEASGAKTQKLADGSEGAIFGKPTTNKHGFHAVHMADKGTRKQLLQARAIERHDLDDCAFTLC